MGTPPEEHANTLRNAAFMFARIYGFVSSANNLSPELIRITNRQGIECG